MKETERKKEITATFSIRNRFYKRRAHYFLIALMCCMLLFLIAVGVVLYQLANRPLPEFHATQPGDKKMVLTPFASPNLLPDTIIRFASKAAITAYTFDFVNYDAEIALARPYFTAAGWQSYQNSISKLISTIVSRQLFVTGVVVGAPVISNQGDITSQAYAWRVQIPFLVTYQSANAANKQNYYVVLTIVRVPTSDNPQGIGVDQFVMV